MRFLACCLVVGFLISTLGVSAQEPREVPEPEESPQPQEPIPSDVVEEEEVRLVILDVLVVDRAGRTVPDLTLYDFKIAGPGGRELPIDTLDVDCSVGSMDDPKAVKHASKRESPELGDGRRRIVIAIDYLHLPRYWRTVALENAQQAVQHNASPGDEIMVVALNGGLRIEQPFSSDRNEVIESLRRMQYDITLWEPDYFHLHESLFVDPFVALLDVLAQFDGTKAVVLYSMMNDVPFDIEFERIAAVAATSRCSIYPVDAAGLRPLNSRTTRSPG